MLTVTHVVSQKLAYFVRGGGADSCGWLTISSYRHIHSLSAQTTTDNIKGNTTTRLVTIGPVRPGERNFSNDALKRSFLHIHEILSAQWARAPSHDSVSWRFSVLFDRAPLRTLTGPPALLRLSVVPLRPSEQSRASPLHSTRPSYHTMLKVLTAALKILK